MEHLAADPRLDDPGFAAVLDRIGRISLLHGGPRLVGVAIFIGLILMVGIAIALRPRVPSFAVVITFTAITFGLVMLAHRLVRHRSAVQIGAVLLKDALCPSCAYSL